MSSEVSMPGAEHDREPTVEELKRALAEAREEQAATAEILRVISSSPMDLKRVLAELAASAAHHCGAYDASIFQVDGDFLRLVGHYGPIPALPAGDDSLPLTRSVATGRAVLDRRTIHVADMQAAADEYPESRARSLDFRTILAVPLIRAGKATGAIGIRRTEARLFNHNQIKLLETFANQAVIAIENTRLFEAEQASKRELRESLEYQTAISEVLAVISRSPSDLQPVLGAIVETAARLCQADKANIRRKDGDRYRTVASIGFMHAQRHFVEQTAVELDPTTLAGRVALDRETVHIPDVLEDRNLRMDIVSGIDFRTGLGVPLLREGELIGLLLLAREKQQPYSRRQIALVETFADQAVIAIENARLFEAEQASKRELTEALEQQTATADVLKVISRSAFDLQAVLDTLVESAARLCHADKANIARITAGAFQFISFFGFKPEYREYLLSLQTSMADRGSITGRTVVEGRTVHVVDLMADPEFTWFEAQKRGGFRTALGVPLMREGTPIGVFFLAREEVEPFSQQEIDLVTTFADQAVIAIENTRLFEQVQVRTAELQESLEYQTATGEVLNVISSSKFDLQPVLDTIVETAARLCQAEFAFVFRLDADQFDLVAASKNVPAETIRWIADHAPTVSLDRGSLAGRVALERTTIHMPDVLTDREYKEWGAQKLGGIRSQLGVPLLRDGLPVGVICLARTVVKPFTDKQIELVSTFAEQAVIAIENTRLFEEVQARNRDLSEALEQQTATSEVLKVIGRSTFDLQPVLETLVENAARLCNASMGIIFRFDGEVFRWAADYGNTPEHRDYQQRNPVGPGPGSTMGRAALCRRSIQIPDVLADPEFEHTEAQKIANFRTLLGVPMFRQGVLLGVFSLQRQEVKPFTDKQIELVETFADQAVIAIENVRLFEEAQSRARELARSVQELQALGEVGRAISSSLDLKVVLKTIVDRAVHLSGTDAGSIFYYREGTGKFELGETTGLHEQVVATFRKLDISVRESGLAEAIARRQPLQIPDLTQRPSEPLRDAVLEAGFRASLVVPLLGAEGPLGTLILRRRIPGEFSTSVVSLMQAFADQSAIALENARLFNEIADKSRELEIASQHKSQFVANMSHELRTPLAAILGYAELMQEGFYGTPSEKSMEALTRIRSNGKHLLGLINTVLDIAKIESGQFTLNMSEYAIESVVETARSATESLAQNKKLILSTDVAKSLPFGLGDEQRLTQVLLNLVGNAIKFTDAGEVRVTVKAINGHFAVSVADTGPGIPEHERSRIFEQFHQIDSSNTKAKGGTGLGLAIAKQIVEMHGGRIWVESTLGKGSTFRMELPMRTAAAGAA